MLSTGEMVHRLSAIAQGSTGYWGFVGRLRRRRYRPPGRGLGKVAHARLHSKMPKSPRNLKRRYKRSPIYLGHRPAALVSSWSLKKSDRKVGGEFHSRRF